MCIRDSIGGFHPGKHVQACSFPIAQYSPAKRQIATPVSDCKSRIPARGCGHPEGGLRMGTWASPAWGANTPTLSLIHISEPTRLALI
eukprot:8089509-Alexandrium_andersonii.AAC.1